MSDLGPTRSRKENAPEGRPLEELNELYCRTKVAEAQAAEQGFAGTAAALAAIAALMAEEPGMDHGLVRRLARSAPGARAACACSPQSGHPLVRH